MEKRIQTSKLGEVFLSEHLIKAFIAVVDDIKVDDANDEIMKILKSHELEEIKPPAAIPSINIEMWVHRSTELIFCVFLKNSQKYVSSVIKGDMSGLVFDEE